jgi:metal-sulfur cluster biosynthetic enzyme
MIPEGNRPLGRHERITIKMDLTETGCDNEDWIQLAQDRILLWAHVTANISNFHIRWGISLPAKQLSVSQQTL